MREIGVLIVFVLLVCGCKTSGLIDGPTSEGLDGSGEPAWLNEDCQLRSGYYYFVGFGEGGNMATALQSALISSRQNALACVFGGTIASSIDIKESAEELAYDRSTTLTLNYEHVNWSGYEQVEGHVLRKDKDGVYSQYRWHIDTIKKEQERLKSLARKVEENRALQKEVEAARKISAEKQKLVAAQKAELDQLKKQENEVKNMRSQRDRVLKRLAKIKELRARKGNEFIHMVVNMGCDVTYRDLEELIGKPEKVEVRGICAYGCDDEVPGEYIPVLSYYYGDFRINAYVPDEYMIGEKGWAKFKKYMRQTQISKIEKYIGKRDSWFICETEYMKVMRDRG